MYQYKSKIRSTILKPLMCIVGSLILINVAKAHASDVINRVTSQGGVSAGEVAEFFIDYSANDTREIQIDLFDEDMQWVTGTRQKVSQNEPRWATLFLDVPENASPGTYIIWAKILPVGASWGEFIDQKQGEIVVSTPLDTSNLYWPFPLQTNAHVYFSGRDSSVQQATVGQLNAGPVPQNTVIYTYQSGLLSGEDSVTERYYYFDTLSGDIYHTKQALFLTEPAPSALDRYTPQSEEYQTLIREMRNILYLASQPNFGTPGSATHTLDSAQTYLKRVLYASEASQL